MKRSSGCLELDVNKPDSMKLTYFFSLFSRLNTIVDEKYPKLKPQFSSYRGALITKMQLLELIKYRYVMSARLVDECFEIADKKLSTYSTSADPSILKESSDFSERFRFSRRSIVLDIESFLVFSRVVLDYVPWILQPFLKGYITREEPKTTDFRQFCEWFRDNPDKVIDEKFKNFLLKFYYWFMDNLRNPRNDLVIHLKRNYTLDSFSSNGKVVRLMHLKNNSRDSSEEKFDLVSPIEAFKEVYNFIRDIEGYFVKIL